MSAIVNTLANGLNAVGSWLVQIVSGVWDVVLLAFDAIGAFLVGLVGLLVTGIVLVLGILLDLLLSAVPDMPQADQTGIGGISALQAANAYVPLGEALALLPVMGAVAGGIGVYKLAKFIRGGG